MDSSRVLYMFLCLLAVLHLTSQAPAWLTDDRVLKCPANLYYDHGTGHCEDCRDICQFAKIQRTEEACQQQCPDYLRSKLCKSPDQYYDENVQSCASCAELCSKAEITGTLPECQNKCQGYLDLQAPKQRASHHSSDTLKASHTASNDKSSDEDTVDLHPGYIVAICAGGFVVAFLTTFIIVHRQCNRKYEKTPQQDPDNESRPSTTPVEESSHSSGSQHFTSGECRMHSTCILTLFPVHKGPQADNGHRWPTHSCEQTTCAHPQLQDLSHLGCICSHQYYEYWCLPAQGCFGISHIEEEYNDCSISGHGRKT